MRCASAQWRWKWCAVSHVGHGYMSESEAFVGGMSCYANMVKCCSLWATRLAGAWDCCVAEVFGFVLGHGTKRWLDDPWQTPGRLNSGAQVGLVSWETGQASTGNQGFRVLSPVSLWYSDLSSALFVIIIFILVLAFIQLHSLLKGEANWNSILFHLKSVEAQASGVNGSATPESDDVS